MTTSVIYPSSMGAVANGQTLTGISYTRACAFNVANQATIAQQVNATGTGTSMASGTLTNTPTSGNVLLAVIQRIDNNAITSNPSGWTLLTGGGNTGRRVEVWWYRSTGIAADKGPFTFSTSSGAVRWGIQLFEFGGNAAYRDPVVKTAATTTASASTITATTTPLTTDDTVGMTLVATSVAGTSLGAGGITTAFSGTGTPESTTAYYDSTFGNGATAVVDLYTNATYGTDTYGATFTLGAARTGVYAVIQLAGGGVTHSAANQIYAGIGTGFYGSAMGQGFCVYDTSTIPGANTITSASLGVYAYNGSTDPTSGDLEARYYGTSITNSRGYDNNLWVKTTSAAAALPLLATFPAASSFTANNAYTLTNNGTNLVSNINRAGNTVILFTSSDYTTNNSVLGGAYALDTSSTRAPLTIVHNFQGTATAAASAGMTPAITRRIGWARSAAATIGNTPAISKTIGYARTAAATAGVTPAIARTIAYARSAAATIGNTPAIARTVAYARTITSTIGNTPVIVTGLIPAIVGTPRTLVLEVRNKLTLTQLDTLRLKINNKLRLPEE